MPVEEIEEEEYYLEFSQHTENKVMALIEDVTHKPGRDIFAKNLMRRIVIEEPDLAKTMYNELAYWISHDEKRL
jgi:proteasome assembly chaperone (PAC2) family protein